MKTIAIIVTVACVIGAAGAQEWHWELNRWILNPSHVEPLGMNTPFTGDFDGDGDIDMIVGCRGGTIQYYENIGTPDSAAWQQDEDYFASVQIDSMLVPKPSLVDLESDGTRELYLTLVDRWGSFAGALAKYRNIGTPEEPIWQQDSFDIGYDLTGHHAYQFVDFDGDSDLDLATATLENWDHPLTYFKNIGDIYQAVFQLDTLVFATYDPFSGYGLTYNLHLVNLFGESKLELLALIDVWDVDGAEAVCFINQGTNDSPTWEIFDSMLWTYSNMTVSLADIDDDNDFDVIAGDHSVPLACWENVGGPDSSDFAFSNHLGPYYLHGCLHPTFIDYDSDGDRDMTFFYLYSVMGDYLQDWGSAVNVGSLTLPRFSPGAFVPHIFALQDLHFVSDGDLNGDGFPDLAMNGGTPRFFVNDTGAGFDWNPDTLIVVDPPSYREYPELADLNSDGILDLLVRDSGGALWKCFQNTGTPQQFAWNERPEWIAGISSGILIYRGANLNRDSRIDLVGIDPSYHLRGFINTGTGDDVSFLHVPEIFFEEPWPAYTVYYFDCADLDGDGDDDVIVNKGGVVTFIENMYRVSIDDYSIHSRPGAFALSQNYPNPFNSSTTIAFTLEHADQVSLSIYDIAGRLVTSFTPGRLSPGEHRIAWDGRNSEGKQMPSGVYLYAIDTGEQVLVKMMVLLK